MLELPKELQFSSDDDDAEEGADSEDLAGFEVILRTKKTVKYVPDHERMSDGAKIGFNYKWHDSIRREKNLILEPPRATNHIHKSAVAPSEDHSANVRLPTMMESILSNMQHNQEVFARDRQMAKSGKSPSQAVDKQHQQ